MNCRNMICLLITILIFTLFGQDPYDDSLCAYTWQSNINDCDSVIDCINIDEWNNKIKDVPLNISRISSDSLKLCTGFLNLSNPVDIIYIIELSGSMIDVGDPFRKRDDALRAGFQYQIDSLKQSHAGYIGFGRSIPPEHVLAPINVTNGQTQLMEMADYLQTYIENDQNARGCRYNVALEKAISMLDDPVYCPHETKAIIFITDGEPNSGYSYTNSQLQYLTQNNVKVHGIFLGIDMGTAISNLASQTGGTSTLTTPMNNDTLVEIVKEIVDDYRDATLLEKAILINSRTNDTVTSVGSYEVTDTILGVKMNTFLPLGIGTNDITVYSQFTSLSGYDTTLDFQFIINVSDEEYTSECYYCWHRADLKALVGNTEIDTLTGQNNTFNIQLEYFGKDSLSQIEVDITTPNKQDSESAVLSNSGWNGQNWTFTGPMPFKVTPDSAVINNDTTEAGNADFVYLKWIHPKDTRDSAFDTVIVAGTSSNNLVIYDKPGDPATITMKQYKTSPDTTVLIAGDTAQLYAKVFAQTVWNSEYETNPDLGNLITWSFDDVASNQQDTSVGNLADTNGNHNKFYPKKAGKLVNVTASLKLRGLPEINETIRLFIIAGPAINLVIEESLDSTVSPWDPAPYDTITIYHNEISKIAYGIFRDIEGNWIEPSGAALWTEDDSTVVTVSSGPGYTVTITKNPANLDLDTTIIHAVQVGLEGTSNVIIMPYEIDSFRIVVDSLSSYIPIDSITLLTDNDSTIYVQGRRSDDSSWILVDGNWGIDDTSVVKIPPPQGSNSWNIQPKKDTAGIIFSSLGNNTDTITYSFQSSGIIQVEFILLTTDSLCIAGDTLQGEVRIYNKDGLVPGTCKYNSLNKAMYSDTLSDGGLTLKPFVTTCFSTSGTDSDTLNSNTEVEQWFEGGIDTLNFILYSSATSKTEPQKKHKLRVKLGSLTNSTREFLLKSGPINTIVLTPDSSLILDTNDIPVTITADGYDTYGNYLPDSLFHWTNDTSLIDYDFDIVSKNIVLDPGNASVSQQGCAWVQSLDDTTIWNKIYVTIGLLPTFYSAFACDYNGNGYLDAIEVKYSREFVVPSGYKPDSIIVENANPYKRFEIDSLVSANPGGETKNFILYLNEDHSRLDTIPQTDWRPQLIINDIISISDVETVCEDGAGPVVWSVYRKVTDNLDRTKDEVTVTLSENIYNFSGDPFISASPKPSAVFKVWNYPDTSFVDSMLQGIDKFENQQDTRTLFKMKNGYNLDSDYLINIEPNTYLADSYGNLPNSNNQKVQLSADSISIEDDEPSSSCGNCGSGSGLAFIPLIWLKGMSLFRKRRRKRRKL